MDPRSVPKFHGSATLVTAFNSPVGRLINNECSGKNVKQMQGVDSQSGKHDDSKKEI
jgi:hypothetical protein